MLVYVIEKGKEYVLTCFKDECTHVMENKPSYKIYVKYIQTHNMYEYICGPLYKEQKSLRILVKYMKIW